MIRKTLSELLHIEHPIILAPMFLVSNAKMIIEALRAGITGAIPALNYRTTEELRVAIREIKETVSGPFGINLIVSQSNFQLKDQFQVCLEEKVTFIITSLGSPKEIIEEAHQQGIFVFCDVTDTEHARKVEALGADGLIAVSKEAGGHAGQKTYQELIADLKEACSLPIISAGGIGDKKTYKERLSLGVAGVSVGTIFIASEESPVSNEYKQACIEYGAKDIVMTTKLSGTPCSVINTPYVQQVGTEQNAFERFLNRHKRIKKWVKALTYIKGMKSLQKAAFSQTYKTVWCAGPSIEYVHQVRPIREIVKDLVE